jgi:ketosteroid isomerase-like protein
LPTPDVVSTIRDLERQRCQALIAGDIDALEKLLADTVVHVHTDGRIDDRASFLALVRDRLDYLTVTRGDLTVLELGDVALATGPIEQLVRIRATGQTHPMRFITSQVWRRADVGWRQVSFQATNLATPA